MMFSNLLM